MCFVAGLAFSDVAICMHVCVCVWAAAILFSLAEMEGGEGR